MNPLRNILPFVCCALLVSCAQTTGSAHAAAKTAPIKPAATNTTEIKNANDQVVQTTPLATEAEFSA
jgi:hypothetical protein